MFGDFEWPRIPTLNRLTDAWDAMWNHENAFVGSFVSETVLPLRFERKRVSNQPGGD